MNYSFYEQSSNYEVSTTDVPSLNSTLNTTAPQRRRANLETAKYISIGLTILSSYTVLALLFHSYKSKSVRKKSFASVLCLLAGACSLFVTLSKLFELWVGHISCRTYHQASTAVYGVGLALIYTTLWIRQRKLYSDELLVHTVSKVSRIISAAVIVLIYLLLFFVFSSFIAVLQFERDYPPCHVEWLPLSSLLPLVVFFITSCFILQLILFLLMVNPLRRGSSICRDVLCTRSKNDIHAMLKRLAVCACVCILSTIGLSIAMLLDSVEIICIYWGNLMAFDILVSTLSTSCSFADWNKRIFPMLSCLGRKVNSAIQNSVIMEEPTSEKIIRVSLASFEMKPMMENGNGHMKESTL